MSEPESKLDLTALQDALDDPTPATSAAAAADKDAAAPYTLPDEPAASASSAPAAAPKPAEKPAAVAPALAAAKPASTPAATPAAAAAPAAPEATGDPNVDAIRAMFPTFDADTVREVLAHNGGDMEGAVNSLLSMTDPTYVAPPRAPASSTLESDALLAASLAAEDREPRRSPTSGAAAQPARPFFEGTGATYDASQLTYAPRVRRNPPSAAARAAYSAPPPPGLEAITPDKPVVEGWPGPQDTKRWMDQIDKAAESGLSKAASTFSALRQRVTQASSPDGTASPSGSGSGAATPSSRGGGGAASFFAPLVSSVRNATSGGSTPARTSSTSGYDRDPAPVGNAELAALLARGSAPPSKADRILGTRASAGAFDDRYGSSANAARPSAAAANKAQPAAPAEEEEEELGWGDVGRAPPAKAGKSKIAINDNTKPLPAAVVPKPAASAGDSVNKMDAAAGRGLISPTSSSAAAKGVALGAGAGAAAGVGAAAVLGAGSAAHEDDDEDDEEGGSDLEYVSNPFENDD